VNGERLTGAALLAGLCFLAACGPSRNPPELAKQPLSTRARESALAKSGLPGATGIGAALRVSDSADARRKREDSVSNAVP
jgi:hypothetical protein